MTHHGYLEKTANEIIDEDTAKELSYLQLSKNQKYKKIWKQFFAKKTR